MEMRPWGTKCEIDRTKSVGAGRSEQMWYKTWWSDCGVRQRQTEQGMLLMRKFEERLISTADETGRAKGHFFKTVILAVSQTLEPTGFSRMTTATLLSESVWVYGAVKSPRGIPSWRWLLSLSSEKLWTTPIDEIFAMPTIVTMLDKRIESTAWKLVRLDAWLYINYCTDRNVNQEKQQCVTPGCYILVGRPDPNVNNEDYNIAYNRWLDYPLFSTMRPQPLEHINVYAESNNSGINDRVDYFRSVICKSKINKHCLLISALSTNSGTTLQ